MSSYLKNFFTKINRRFLFVLAISLSLSACADSQKLPKPPISIPFHLEEMGSKIETEFRIIEHNAYSFNLVFSYKENDQMDRLRVRKLTGGYEVDKTGKLLDPGVPIFLMLKISQIDAKVEKVFFLKKSSEQVLDSWGWDSFSKKIADVPLPPGDYKISVESLRKVPELVGTKVNLHIARAYQGK